MSILKVSDIRDDEAIGNEAVVEAVVVEPTPVPVVEPVVEPVAEFLDEGRGALSAPVTEE